MDKQFSDVFPNTVLPAHDGIYRAFDKDLNRWYYNWFKNGSWHLGYSELEDCQKHTNREKMSSSKISKWYGLAKPAV